MFKLILAASAATFALAAPASAAELIVNGGFDDGLNGWTSYATANGTITANPSTLDAPVNQRARVTAFDVTGAGESDAATFNAGIIAGATPATPAGGGIFQTFTSGKGSVTFLTDIAATVRQRDNASGGILSVLLDGVELDSFDFGDIRRNATERSTLSFTADLAAGTHTLTLQALRPYQTDRNLTGQYFDNVSLDFAAVPEPATWAMMIGGFGVVGGSLRRRARVAVAA